MRADGGDLEPCPAGELGQFAAKIKDVCARVLDRIADLGAELDYGLVHLGFDLLFEHDLAALENFLNMRTQLARLRIDNGELLFNPESEGVLFGAHCGGENVPQKCENVILSASEARSAACVIRCVYV